MNRKSVSLKFKLVSFMLVLLLLTISILTYTSTAKSKNQMLNSARDNGMTLAGSIVEELVLAGHFQTSFNKQFDDKLESVAYLVGQSDTFSNAQLIRISKDLDIAEINIANNSGEILYSNHSENLGYVYPKTHPMGEIIYGSTKFMSEAIRKSEVDQREYKYGGARASSEYVVQVGLDATSVHEIIYDGDYQTVIEKVGENPEVLYALFVDLSSTAIAHSIPDRIGLDLSDDSGIQTALDTQKAYASEFDWNYNDHVYHAYDTILPFIVDGELKGVINIGIELDDQDAAINKFVTQTILTALAILAISGILIYLFLGYELKALVQLSKTANEAAGGNLRIHAASKRNDEIGAMTNAFNNMIQSLRSTIQQINDISGQVFESTTALVNTTNQVTEVTNQIATATGEVAEGAERQVEVINEATQNVRQVVSNIEDMKIAVTKVTEETNRNDETVIIAESKVSTLSDQMNKISNRVESASTSMHELQEIAQRIGDIIDLINSIADQTNLLALNASIEAARAGEHGRGFAVVAEEIRKLAEESRSSTESIRELIEETQASSNNAMSVIQLSNDDAHRGQEILEDVLDSFTAIKQGVSFTRDSMTMLTEQRDAITTSIQQLYTLIENVEQTSQMSAANSEEVAASTDEQSASVEEINQTIRQMESIIKELKKSVDVFQI